MVVLFGFVFWFLIFFLCLLFCLLIFCFIFSSNFFSLASCLGFLAAWRSFFCCTYLSLAFWASLDVNRKKLLCLHACLLTINKRWISWITRTWLISKTVLWACCCGLMRHLSGMGTSLISVVVGKRFCNWQVQIRTTSHTHVWKTTKGRVKFMWLGSNRSVTLSGNSLRQTVHSHCASFHQAAKLVAALLRVVGVTAGLAESNGSLTPGLWLTSPAGWLQGPGSALEPYAR